MYVWIDALANYITGLGWADEGPRWQRYWRDAEVRTHVIGKGITRFHAVYWPAMLLSAGVTLPTDLMVHGYLTANGQKISKSLGNAVAPAALAERYGAVPLRWSLLAHCPTFTDGDFNEARMVAGYHDELANGLGNLASRVTTMLLRYRDGRGAVGGHRRRAGVGPSGRRGRGARAVGRSLRGARPTARRRRRRTRWCGAPTPTWTRRRRGTWPRTRGRPPRWTRRWRTRPRPCAAWPCSSCRSCPSRPSGSSRAWVRTPAGPDVDALWLEGLSGVTVTKAHVLFPRPGAGRGLARRVAADAVLDGAAHAVPRSASTSRWAAVSVVAIVRLKGSSSANAAQAARPVQASGRLVGGAGARGDRVLDRVEPHRVVVQQLLRARVHAGRLRAVRGQQPAVRQRQHQLQGAQELAQR